MKNLILFLTGAICFFKITAFAQNNEIIVKGHIDSSIVNRYNLDTLKVKSYNFINKLNGIEQFTSSKIDANGDFYIKIYAPTGLKYISFWAQTKASIFEPSKMINLSSIFRQGDFEEFYLFEIGDKCNVQFRPDGVLKFSGNGSDKLNCQSQIYNVTSSQNAIANRRSNLFNSKKFDEALHLMETSLELDIKLKLAILKSYKSQFSKQIYDLIYLDALALSNYNFLYPLTWMITDINDVDKAKSLNSLQHFYKSFLLKNRISNINSPEIIKSAYFTEYLFQKEYNLYKFYSKNYRNGDSFTNLYFTLKQKYKGSLRDDIILISIRRLAQYFSFEVKSHLDNAITTVQQQNYKEALKQFNTRKYGEAFPFELQDTLGKIHRLRDFKGKLLIIDFWFSGCTYCAILSSNMKSIIDKYKSNKNIVFMSISTDQSRSQWIKSILSDKYTSREILNLYTNGLGSRYEMLPYYNYVGAPQLLIIDKNGKVITSNPPRPTSNEVPKIDPQTGNYIANPTATLSTTETKSFIKIINDNLPSELIENVAR